MTRTQFYYKNHRGVTELRSIEPVALQYVATPHLEYGYAPGWFLHGLDFTERDGVARTGEKRSFALDHIQMEGFKYGTRTGSPAFKLLLTVAGVLPVDEPTGIPGHAPKEDLAGEVDLAMNAMVGFLESYMGRNGQAVAVGEVEVMAVLVAQRIIAATDKGEPLY